MVRLRLLRWSLASVALIAARPAVAAPIPAPVTLTGNVEADFNSANPNVHVTPVSANPLNIGQAPWITGQGWVSGWSIQDVRTSYDAKTDTLSVGLDTFKNSQGVTSIVGDSDGNGNAGVADPRMSSVGGLDTASLGGHKSVAVAFAPDAAGGGAGNPVVIAGVPADKSQAGPGVDGFNVAAYKGVNLGLGYNFGATLTNNLGALAFDPSAQHPGFEFTIKNFSKIPGIDPTKGFWMSLYAGSPDDVIAGETSLPLTRVAAFAPETIPEPSTVLAWSLAAAGAAAVRLRRRSKG